MADYVRKSSRFILRGVNITQPGDMLSPEFAQVMQNLRCLRVGEWRQRPGTSLIADINPAVGETASVRSIVPINNEATSTYRRVVLTADGKLFKDNAANNSFTQIGTGFSGNPLTSALARPERSPYPYALLADRDKMAKVDSDGNLTEWGLAAPVRPLSAEIAQMSYKTIEICESTSGFTAPEGGTITAVDRIPTATTVSKVVYDLGSSGWANIIP